MKRLALVLVATMGMSLGAASFAQNPPGPTPPESPSDPAGAPPVPPPRADSGSQCASAFAQQSRPAGADAGTRSQSPDSGSEQAWYAEGPAGESGRSSAVHTRTHSAC